jgi:peptidyl-prolyl cis-trans isomerase B (cyclophilin B)
MKKKQNHKLLGIIALVLAAAAMIAIIAISMVKNNSMETEDTLSDATASPEVTDTTSDADAESTPSPEPVEPLTGKHHVEIEIEGYGTIKVELDGDAAPITVGNFVQLAESGFYDGLTFHRIISGFMIQGGDPTGTGRGGSEQTITGEFAENGVENPLSHTRGAISMARSQSYDSASSQFFIVHEDSTYLDGSYAVFGYVTEGMEIVDQICQDVENWTVDQNGVLQNPEEQPVISSITVLD